MKVDSVSFPYSSDMNGEGPGNGIEEYRVDLMEPVYDETMAPRADFFTAGD